MVERILRFRCGTCSAGFMVDEDLVDDLRVSCPICGTEVDNDQQESEDDLDEEES